jgi:hypothetical protein
MTKTLRLRVSGSVPVHGKTTGEEFDVPTDAEGTPLELLWRKRVADKSVAVISAPGAVAVASEPSPPAPVPSKKKEG